MPDENQSPATSLVSYVITPVLTHGASLLLLSEVPHTTANLSSDSGEPGDLPIYGGTVRVYESWKQLKIELDVKTSGESERLNPEALELELRRGNPITITPIVITQASLTKVQDTNGVLDLTVFTRDFDINRAQSNCS